MNQISKHIAYLLLSCRKVFVPGLGSFSASCERANFDPVDGIFYPSRIRINFSPNRLSTAINIETSIERRLKIKEKEAASIIEDYVINIREKITSRHYCRLEGIGYLMEDNQGKISFIDTFWKRQKFPSSATLIS